MNSISRNGEDLHHVECDLPLVLVQWLELAVKCPKVIGKYLTLLNNVLRIHTAYFDEVSVKEIVTTVSTFAYYDRNAENIFPCLKVLETIVAFSFIAPAFTSEVLTLLITVEI